jgi:amino acid transporter
VSGAPKMRSSHSISCAYNCLLNTTSKFRASMAACMTILSYMATAVIPATEAVHYSGNLVPGLPTLQVTLGLLAVFAALSIVGITESAVVAIAIFVFHIFTLICFCLVGGYFILREPSMLAANWRAPSKHHIGVALFFGFAAALLGISGFESSSNFIEEQKEGVFPKTLRNMWVAVTIFNPLICLLVLGVLPITSMQEPARTCSRFLAPGWLEPGSEGWSPSMRQLSCRELC